MPCERAVNSRRIDFTACLILKIFVSADVVSVRVSVINCRQIPAVRIKYLPDFPPCILVVSAVNQADIFVVQFYKPDVRRTFDVISPL